MTKMQKAVDKMKHAFFDGEEEDPAAKQKVPKAAAGVKRKWDEIESVNSGVENIVIEEEKKEPSGKKRVKKEEDKSFHDLKVSNRELKLMIEKQTLEKQTVGWLKDVLEEWGVTTKSRAKAKLVEEVIDWSNNN